MTARLVTFLSVLWLAGCVAVPALPPDADGPRSHAVQVMSNGWHTAIIVTRDEVSATGLLPEAADFPQADFLEFGWGDREYYPADETTLGLTLRAALVPTPAVMHVAGRTEVPEPREGREVVEMKLTETGFRHMVQAIAEQFERPDGGAAEPLGPGLYPDSLFYAADGSFHLFNTCNTWTVRMLRAGGVDVSPSGVITAGDVMERLEAWKAGRSPAA